jgi:hypothetical protein
MRGEFERMLEDHVFERDAPLPELFVTRRTFVNHDLADLYGLPGPDPAEMDAEGFAPASWPDDGPRAGILGLAGYLALGGKAQRTSPTLRGIYLRTRLLCQTIPEPPPDVEAELEPQNDDDGTYQTMRERLERHAADPACISCHQFVDPPGLALEHFDGIGAYRADDNGHRLDVSGEVDGVSFDGLEGLGETLRDSPQVHACIVRQLYRHATGHIESTPEEPLLESLTAAFDGSEERFSELVLELVASDGFRLLGVVEEQPDG